MCYTFDLLGPQFSAAHVRQCVEAFELAAPDGWPCWAFSNHDVVRHVTRWAKPGSDPSALARFSIDLLCCLRGSICLYQGEELGLEEAELAFEDLRDPYGIRFWPGFKGRDGARTPMVWHREEDNAGFTTGRPWLPIPPGHRARAADVQQAEENSILQHYRAALYLRTRHPALKSGTIRFLDGGEDVLAFIREADGEKLLCAFNFSDLPARWTLPDALGAVTALDLGGYETAVDGNGLTLPGLSAFIGTIG
jgi:alpha-glucosidase